MDTQPSEHPGASAHLPVQEPALAAGTLPLTSQNSPLSASATVSGEEQRRIFDTFSIRGSWETAHIRLGDVGRGLDADRRLSLHEQTWSAVPSRSFKMFQQLFCHPHDFVVPGNPLRLENGFRPSFPLKTTHPEWYSVLGCLVDPSLFSPSLTTKLHLPDGLANTAKTAYHESTATTLALKYLWESLRPLPQDNRRNPNCRLLVIGLPTTTIRERYQAALSHFDLPLTLPDAGSLLSIRSASPNREAVHDLPLFRPLTLQVFTSAYDALRKTVHESRGYSLEKRVLTPLYLRWHDFQRHDLPRWVSVQHDLKRREAAGTPDLAEQIALNHREINREITATYRSLLTDSLQALRHSTHTEKKVIAQRITAMLQHLDDRNGRRINPNPALLRISSNQALLLLRAEEISDISSYNSQDHYLLLRAVRRQETAIESVHQQLELNASTIHQKRRLFTARQLDSQELYRETSRLLHDLNLPMEPVRHLITQPHLSYGRHLTAAYASLNSALLIGNRDQTEDALLHLYGITSAHHAGMIIHRMMLELSQSLADREQIREGLRDLEKASGVRHLFRQPLLFNGDSAPAGILDLRTLAPQMSALAATRVREALQNSSLDQKKLKDQLKDIVTQLESPFVSSSPASSVTGAKSAAGTEHPTQTK